MQGPDWNDLRHLLAVARGGSLASAARSLGVDPTTVSRRLAALEASAGRPLVRRGAGAGLALTPAGAAVAREAEAMEARAARIPEALAAEAGAAAGSVRLTAVPLLANRLMVPALPRLLAAHPEVTVRLVPERSDLDLRRREADLALRLARPRGGGLSVLSRRVGRLDHAAYVAANGPDPGRWIAFDDTMAHLPTARWLAARIAEGGEAAPLRVVDAETALEAAAAGLGRALLPTCVGDCDPRLRAVPRPGPPPSREAWLLLHEGERATGAVRAVAGWIEATLAG